MAIPKVDTEKVNKAGAEMREALQGLITGPNGNALSIVSKIRECAHATVTVSGNNSYVREKTSLIETHAASLHPPRKGWLTQEDLIDRTWAIEH